MVGCSCVVVEDYGKESQAKDVIKEYFNVRNKQTNLALVFQKHNNNYKRYLGDTKDNMKHVLG